MQMVQVHLNLFEHLIHNYQMLICPHEKSTVTTKAEEVIPPWSDLFPADSFYNKNTALNKLNSIMTSC